MPDREIKLLAAGFLLALLSSFGQTFFIALFGGEIRAEFGLLGVRDFRNGGGLPAPGRRIAELLSGVEGATKPRLSPLYADGVTAGCRR